MHHTTNVINATKLHTLEPHIKMAKMVTSMWNYHSKKMKVKTQCKVMMAPFFQWLALTIRNKPNSTCPQGRTPCLGPIQCHLTPLTSSHLAPPSSTKPVSSSTGPPLIHTRASCPDLPPCPHPLSRFCPPGAYSSLGPLPECPLLKMACPSRVGAPVLPAATAHHPVYQHPTPPLQ